MILRVLVKSGVGFDSSTHILVLDEVGEFIWPSIWVVILTNWGLRVTVLTGDRHSCDGWSSSGCRLRGCVVWLVEWSFVVDLPPAPFGLSTPSSLVVVLLVADLELVVIVLMCGGCLGGDGTSNGRRVLYCVLWFIKWNSFVEASHRSSGSSIPSLLTLYLAVTIVLVLAQL